MKTVFFADGSPQPTDRIQHARRSLGRPKLVDGAVLLHLVVVHGDMLIR